MFAAVGELDEQWRQLISEEFSRSDLHVTFCRIDDLSESCKTISFSKEATKQLTSKGKTFYNWDLLFSVLGPNDSGDDVRKKLADRIGILKAVIRIKSRPISEEFHGSIRVHNLAASAAFYTWLLGVEPKEWTHRYVIFHRLDTKFNFVLLVSDGKDLHHDTLYHLGMGVQSKEKVIEFYLSAQENGFHIEKPPRTTWRGTPLHEMWLKDPDGTLIEIYAKLTDDELAAMPDDKEPLLLV